MTQDRDEESNAQPVPKQSARDRQLDNRSRRRLALLGPALSGVFILLMLLLVWWRS